MKTQSAALPFFGAPAVVSNYVAGAIRSIVARAQEALDRHATMRSLAALSDRDLRDIGFERQEIDVIILTGRFPEWHEVSGRQVQ